MGIVEQIEKKRNERIESLNDSHKSLFGQYLTPDTIASFMSKLAVRHGGVQNTTIKVLDPGAGQGILCTSIVERIREQNNSCTIHVDAIEIDDTIIKDLKSHLSLLKRNKNITFNIMQKDFIESMVHEINSGSNKEYSHIVMNPPYKKMNVQSTHHRLLSEVGIDTVNLYSAFVGLSIKLLKKDGVLVAIIPRSFCNGRYFLPFRKLILNSCRIVHIHSFESRTEAFKEEAVLQENIIIVLKKCSNIFNDIIISNSSDRMLNDYKENYFPFGQIIKPDDAQLYINLPINSENISDLPITNTLEDLNLTVSTGPIVDFRMKEKLLTNANSDSIPLLYTLHFKDGRLKWPVESKKPNAICLDKSEILKLAFPPGNYVVVKRFSSKEEKRRIWASFIFENDFKETFFTAENHLNIFHFKRKGVNKDLAYGLYIYLNTFYVDNIFRKFSGHTQVNATDLKNMKYPNALQLVKMSKIYKENNSLSFDEILHLAVKRNV